MGYFINPIEKNTFGDVLPVFGDEKGGFDLVTDGRGKLFKTIVALSESLEETRKELFKDGGLKTPQEWHEIISVTIGALGANSRTMRRNGRSVTPARGAAKI